MKAKYVRNIVGYTLTLDAATYREWEAKISANTPLAGEIVGFLLGGALPKYETVHCAHCKKPILLGEQVDPEHGYEALYWSNFHEACYEAYRQAKYDGLFPRLPAEPDGA